MEDSESKPKDFTVETERKISAVIAGERQGCVVCGDCREVLPLIPAGTVRLVWTDPPYGSANAQGSDFLARRNYIMADGRRSASSPIANDEPENMRRVVSAMLTDAARVLNVEASCCCVCCGGGGPKPTFVWLTQRMSQRGLRFFHSVIWDKKNPGVGRRFRRQHEMIIVGIRAVGGKMAWNENSPAIPNVLSISAPHNRMHPNQKPLELVERFVSAITRPGDIVLDPFCGSGTTCVAAKLLGRRFIGVEMDERFCEMATNRVQSTTRKIFV